MVNSSVPFLALVLPALGASAAAADAALLPPSTTTAAAAGPLLWEAPQVTVPEDAGVGVGPAAFAMEPFLSPQAPAGSCAEPAAGEAAAAVEEELARVVGARVGPVAAKPIFTRRAQPTLSVGEDEGLPGSVKLSDASIACCISASSIREPPPRDPSSEPAAPAEAAAAVVVEGASEGMARSSWIDGPRRASSAALASATSLAASRLSPAARLRRRRSRCASSSAKGASDSGGTRPARDTSANLKVAAAGRWARKRQRRRVASLWRGGRVAGGRGQVNDCCVKVRRNNVDQSGATLIS